MFFTQEDFKKIEDYLKSRAIRDTEFQPSESLTGEEEISFIQDGKNVKTTLNKFLESFRTSNFINITEIGNSPTGTYTLEEAIDTVPLPSRTEGCIITYISSEDNDWKLYQFLGKSTDEWYDLEMWRNILQVADNHFKGAFENEDLLYASVPNPEVGDYAFVGLKFNESVIYRCRNRWVWSPTTENASDYIKVIVDGNITVGSNGNWFQNGEDTGIKAQGPKGEKGDSVKGDKGDTPVMRLNKPSGYVQYGYDGIHWENLVPLTEFVINNNPDNEDIEADENNKLQFADKSYNVAQFSGLGRKYLRKNIQQGKNVLTQDVINQENTIYIIQYDYDLNGAEITIPVNCTLQFEGGSLSNGTVNCNKTIINAKPKNNIFKNINTKGFTSSKCYVEWFGAISYGGEENSPIYSSDAIQKAFDSIFYTIEFNRGIYYLDKTIILTSIKNIIFDGISTQELYSKYNIEFQKTIVSNTIITSKTDIDLLHISISRYRDNDYDNFISFELNGGCFDVSKVNNYNHTVIKFIAQKGNCIWNHKINTRIYGPLINYTKGDDIDNKGIGIEYVQNENGSFYIADINSHIKGFTYGIKNSIPTKDYMTSFDFRGVIEGCKYFIDFGDGIRMSRVFSTFQPKGYFGDNNENTYIITGDLSEVYIDGIFWDMRLQTNTGLTHKYICKLNQKYQHFVLGNNCKRYINFIDGYKYNIFKNENDSVLIPRIADLNGIEKQSYRGILSNDLHFHQDYTIQYEGNMDAEDTNKRNPFSSGGLNIVPKKDINGSNIIFTITNIPSKSIDDLIITIPPRINPYSLVSFEKVIVELYVNDSLNKTISFNNELQQSIDFSYFKAIVNNRIDRVSNISKIVIKCNNLIMQSTDINKNILILIEGSSAYNNLQQIGTREYTEIRPGGIFNLHGKSLSYKTFSDNVPYLWNITDDERIYTTSGLPKFLNIHQILANISSFKKYGNGVRFISTENNTSLKEYFYSKEKDKLYDALGNPAEAKNTGTYAEKPLASSGIPNGFAYFCTDKQTTEGQANGIMIYHKGSDVWVDALGRTIS